MTLVGAFEATIPLGANDLINFRLLHAGLFFVPLDCLRLATGPIGGWGVDRYGPKSIAVLGQSFLVPVLIVFRLVKAQPRAPQIVLYCILLASSGIGIALIGTPGFVEAGAAVKKYDKRNPGLFGDNGPFVSLYGMTLMAFGFGLTAGPILAGALRNT
jgi:MFS family permease